MPLAHGWIAVEKTLFEGGPDLPPRRANGELWPDLIRETWDAWSSMPHAKLWMPSDWSFATATIEIAARFRDGGGTGLATELRDRERVLGTTLDFRRGLRIRYVEPGASATPADVARLEDYRDL